MKIRVLNRDSNATIATVIGALQRMGWLNWSEAVATLEQVKDELTVELRQIALLFPTIAGKSPSETVKEGVTALKAENQKLKDQLEAKTKLYEFLERRYAYASKCADSQTFAGAVLKKQKELVRSQAQTSEAIQLAKTAAEAGLQLASQRDELQSQLEAVKYNFGVVDRMNDDLLAQNCKLGADKILLQGKVRTANEKIEQLQTVQSQLSDTIIELLTEPAVQQVEVKFVPTTFQLTTKLNGTAVDDRTLEVIQGDHVKLNIPLQVFFE